MVVRAGVLAFALVHLALGLLMLLAPHAFYVHVGPFGARNDHYVRDVASYNLALGTLLLLSWQRFVAWRVPLLAFAALQFALHAANHLHDINGAHPHWIGVADFFELAAGALALGWLAWRAQREPEAGAGGGGRRA